MTWTAKGKPILPLASSSLLQVFVCLIWTEQHPSSWSFLPLIFSQHFFFFHCNFSNARSQEIPDAFSIYWFDFCNKCFIAIGGNLDNVLIIFQTLHWRCLFSLQCMKITKNISKIRKLKGILHCQLHMLIFGVFSAKVQM